MSPPLCEPLVWSKSEPPCDGQSVVLLATFIQSPAEFYCCMSNPAGIFVQPKPFFKQMVDVDGGVGVNECCPSKCAFSPTCA